jgi:hypothetical protein
MLGFLNDVWKYENDILKEIPPSVKTSEPATVKINASNSILINGKVKGRNIELEGTDIVIDGTIEAWNY